MGIGGLELSRRIDPPKGRKGAGTTPVTSSILLDCERLHHTCCYGQIRSKESWDTGFASRNTQIDTVSPSMVFSSRCRLGTTLFNWSETDIPAALVHLSLLFVLDRVVPADGFFLP